ncbi:MAG: hypothetical protein IIW56_02205 [Oscillospiraceae bacterium]|nr:hypothetical protein [Oscillospiraceae bacterium]
MMSKILKRLLSLVLTLALVFQLLPLNAFAAEVLTDTSTEETNWEMPEQEEPDVVGEVEELRDHTSKQFRLSDGSFAAVNYGIPVHYLDDNNNWVDVDNTLTYSNSAGQYLSVNGDEQRGFADILTNGQPVLVSQYGEYNVEMSLLPLTYETATDDSVVPEPIPEATEEPEPEVTEPVTEATAPEETVPETTVPDESFPEVTIPEETEPQTTEPAEPIPDATEPEETAPAVTVPEETGPQVTEPTETEPEITIPTEPVPEATEPAETVPEGTIPEETEPQATEPAETEPETTIPTETIPEPTEPEETVPEVTIPEEPVIPETTPPAEPEEPETGNVIPSSVSAIVLNPGETSTYSTREDMPLSEQFLPEKMGSHVIYESVFPGIDLMYENYGYDIKETILVNELQESYAYRFLLAAEGLTASLNERGSITLTDSEGEVIYEIPVPYMFDAAGETSYAVEYSLEEMEGDYILTVTADAEWIEDESRSFPVSIDPTISLKCEYVNNGTLYTTHVVQGDPNLAHDGTDVQYIGYGMGWNSNQSTTIKECQIYTHVARLPDVPEGCEMVEATLQYYMYGDDSAYSHIGCPTLEIAAYPVTEDNSNGKYKTWIDGLTWNTRPEFNTSNLIDFAVASESTEGSYIQWDVTEQVEEWYANSSITNRTLALVGYESPNYSASHCAIAVLDSYGTSRPPALVVKYRSAIGLESYYTYQNQNIGAAGTAYVSDYTGKLVILKNLVSHASTIMPFSLNMVHNSYYKSAQFKEVSGTGMVFGNGWKLDAVQTLTDCTGDLSNYKLYIDGDGTYHYFLKDGSVWKDEDGLDLTISSVTIKDSSGTSRGSGYQIASGQGDKLCFYKGLLVQQIDSNGNKIFYIYNDTNAGTSGAEWLPNGSGDKLVKVIQRNKGSSTDIVLATIAYDSDGRLDTVTDRMENTTKFTYSGQVCTWAINEDKDETVQYKYSSGRLLEAIDKTSRYKIVYEYNNNRISSFTESASSDGTNWTARTKITVDGSRDKTTYRSPGPDGIISSSDTNSDDLLTTYLFDDEGRTINSNTTNVDKTIVYGASTGAYATTSTTTPALNNHLMNSASIGTVAVNLLTDSGFEKSSGWELKVADNSGTGTSPVRSADSHRTGSKALKFSRTSSDTGVLRAAQSVTGLTSGQTYTFSAYVNTSGITSFGSDGGIYLKVTSGGSGTGDTLDYTTVSTVDGGWTRLSLTFKATASTAVVNVYGKNFVGTAYIDDMQLEKDDAPSNVNLVTNSEMNGSGSTVTGWTAGTNNVTINTNEGIGITKAAAIASTPLVQGYLYQDIPLNLPYTQTYVLSGWANADALPSNQPMHPDVKRFALRAELYYANGTKQDVYLPFSAEIDGEWQFASSVIVPKEDSDVTKIRLYCVYHYNVGTALFDNISLVREPAQTMKYDDNGYLVSVATDGISEDVNTYDGGNLIQTVTQGSGTFDYTYENHNLKTATNGVITQTNTYNTMGNATETELSGTGTSETITTTASYTTDGNHMSTYTDMLNMVYSTAYTNPLNQMYGLPSSTWDQNNVQTVFSYHNDGRTNLQYLRDKESKVEYIRLTNAYDGTKRLTGITRTSGNETNTSSSRTQTYTFGYDVFDQVTTIGVGNRTLTTNTYNSTGNLTRQAFGNGDYVDYEYDELGRVRKTTTETGKTVDYAYNSDGQLASTTSGNLRYDYLYDSLGRLIRSSTHNGSTLKLETRQQYDDSNRLSKQNINLVDSQYEVRYTYNNKGLLTNTSYSSLPDLTYDYDGLQRLTTSENTVRTRTDTYQPNTNLVNKISYTGGSSFTPFDLEYTYDDYGNITSVTAGSVFYNQAYTYDAQGQLTNATINNVAYAYTYDTAGNLLTAKNKTGDHTYVYGDTNGWVDLLTSFDGETITYDNSGNPTSYYNGTSWTFAWQNGRELTSASKSGTSISYTYDGDGIRTSKTVDGITYNYIYASGKLLRQTWTESGTAHVMDFFYDEKGAPYALKYDGNTCYYLLNLQGDVIGITSAAGSRYGVYQYDAYGNIIFQSSHSILAKNPLRYRGYVYDQETGFYYLQSRYYDPAIGRFINADSLASTGQSILGNNMFAYCLNNPVNGCDPCGTCFHRWDFLNDCENCGGQTIKDKLIDYYDNGLTLNGSVGLYGSANLGVFNITGSIEIAADLKGNIQIIGSGSFDVTTAGSVSVIGGATASLYAMPDTSYYAGDTYYTGGSVAVLNPTCPAVAVGVGGNVGKTSDGYWGIDGSLGIGTATAVGAEFHGGYSRTTALTKQFNIFEWILSLS